MVAIGQEKYLAGVLKERPGCRWPQKKFAIAQARLPRAVPWRARHDFGAGSFADMNTSE